MDLFDKNEVPDLRGLDNDAAYAACQAYEDYVYRIADDVSEDTFDNLIKSVHTLYAAYYRLFD